MATSKLTEVTSEGELLFHFHRGQWRAAESLKRFILVLAGTQSGKTIFGPPWLLREIQQHGPGDYLVVTPTYKLLNLKVLPAFLSLFRRQLKLGDYRVQDRVFAFSENGQKRLHGSASETPTQIFFGHAADPESLESATAKAAWLDEAGQNKFRLESWEAILRRLSIHEGRVLLTTTPYNLGWLKQQLYDPWQANKNHPEIDVVNFDSTENPAFPPKEFERARRDLPRWKFDLFYRGFFTRPPGLIYDCFDTERHVVPRFAINPQWRRYLGLDFGGVNTVGIFFAEEPSTKRWYAYREYKPTEKRSARDHVKAIMEGEASMPTCFGGAASEGNWRLEFQSGGLPVCEPDNKESSSEVNRVEVGIDRVYGAIKRDEIRVFADLKHLLDEVGSYSRELDDRGEPTEKIADKETFHCLDATRYVVGSVKKQAGTGLPGLPAPGSSGRHEQAPSGVFLDDY